MEYVIVSTAFLMGFAIGGLCAIGMTYYIGKRMLLKKDEKVSKDTVKTRLAKVRELTEMQYNLQQGADHPQKNALDGKYKNGLNAEVKRLEEEKAEILKSILTDGFDPDIKTLSPTGEVISLKLSEFLNMEGITTPTKETKPSRAEQMGRFTVIKGGKDDNGGTTH